MNKWAHNAARVVTIAGLLSSVGYLVWRAVASLPGAPWWLGVPLLVLETVGVGAAALLAWALWRRPRMARRESFAGGVDVVVRVDSQPVHDVRASLIAARTVVGIGDLIIVDLLARPDVAALATEFSALYAATDEADRNGSSLIAAIGGSDAVLVLEAGDIASPDVISVLAGELADPAVAATQARCATVGGSTSDPTHGAVHDDTFDRDALLPSLGRRGMAVLSESGSLMRRSALAQLDLEPSPISSVESSWRISTQLLAAGWQITAPSGVALVARHSIDDGEAIHDHRVQCARAAGESLVGPQGAFRWSSLSVRQRVALSAFAIRPLSGFRRGCFVALLVGALLSGKLPLRPDVTALGLLWAPGFILTALGLALLSNGALRPGDRTRWSLRALGPSWRSLGHPEAPRRAPVLHAPSFQHGAAPAGVVVVLSAVVAMRGISDQWTHTLGALPQRSLIGLLLVALWMLAISLDVLRLLARPSQLRRARRIVSSFPASLGGRGAFIVDITPLGAGVVSDVPVAIGETMVLDTVIGSASGCTSMSVPATVRNVRDDLGGGFRLGVEFGAHDSTIATALVEFSIVEPARTQLGRPAPAPILGVHEFSDYALEGGYEGRRPVLRLASLLAVGGVVASAVPAAAQASDTASHLVRGTVVVAEIESLPTDTSPVGTSVDSNPPVTVTVSNPATVPATGAPTTDAPDAPAATGVGGAVVVGVCSVAPGPDGAWGTADDEYGPPVSTETAADGTYFLDIDGDACWLTVDPPTGFVPVPGDSSSPTAGPTVIDVSGKRSEIEPVVVTPVDPVARPRTSSVRNEVWDDVDGDGVRDPDEAGIGGVTVSLYGADGLTTGRQVTSDSGEVVFPDLTAGSYSLGVSNVPAGYRVTGLGDNAADPVTGRTGAIIVDGGGDVVDVVIGLVPRASGAAAAPVANERVLPEPGAGQLANSDGPPAGVLAVLAVALAAVLGASVLIGVVRPRRRTA